MSTSARVSSKTFMLMAGKNAPSMMATYRPKKQEALRRPGPAGINGTALRLSPSQDKAPQDYFARRAAANSRATSRARGKSFGSKDMAETRGCPPPPNFSASEARFWPAAAWFQGLVPRETLARTMEALTLTE